MSWLFAFVLTLSGAARAPAQGGPPVITAQPQSQTVPAASIVTFSVAATGSEPLFYQWRRNGTNLANGGRISGAMTPTLRVFNAQGSEMGHYAVVVTNVSGAATSAIAVLALSPVVAWGYHSYGQVDVPAGLSNVVMLAAGGGHSLALRNAGTVAAWGSGYSGQTNVPAGLSNVVAVAAGSSHSLALCGDGRIVAWGATNDGRADVPEGLSNVVAITAGGSHSLALRSDGIVAGWGADYYGQAAVPPGLSNVVAIAAGENYSLVLQRDGTIAAWGFNYQGQTNVPRGLSNVVAIAASRNHSLILRSDGTLLAWGNNSSGEANIPSGLSNGVAIAAGAGYSGNHNLALTRDGTVVGWGDNNFGQTAIPRGLSNVVALSAGAGYSLALGGVLPLRILSAPLSQVVDSGNPALFRVLAVGTPPLTYQWRRNGNRITDATNAFLLLEEVKHNEAGTYSVRVTDALGNTLTSQAALTVQEAAPRILANPGDQVAYPGQRVAFQVGVSGSRPWFCQWRFKGTNLPGATNEVLVLEGVRMHHTGPYAVVVNNEFGSVPSQDGALEVSPVVAWGGNSSGESIVPAGLPNAVAIAAGVNHSLALLNSGSVFAWGATNYSQATVPVGLSDVAAVAGGYHHSLALRSDGTVVAWGRNNFGQTNVPPGLSNAVAIAAGTYHNLALRSDGTVAAWGANGVGQSDVPATLRGVAAIAAGDNYSLALRCDGQVVAWGTSNIAQSIVRAGVSNVVAVAAGASHSLALRSDGTVVAWGDNSSGATNVPPGLSNVVAVAAGSSHSLALRHDGMMVGWGADYSGQSSIPNGLSDVRVMAIAARGGHNLALAEVVPFRILSLPVSQVVASGNPALLRVTAVGAAPLRYQWRQNGQDIPGATNAFLLLASVQTNQTAGYSVWVSDGLGNSSSALATLTVQQVGPQVEEEPVDCTGHPGQDLSFTVSAQGSQPLSYQWRRDGVDLLGATNPVLVLRDVRRSQAGPYAVTVSNPFGTVNSADALLTVNPVVAWGNLTSVPSGLDNAVGIAAGADYNLVLRSSGTVVGWGRSSGPAAVPDGLFNVMAIAAGEHHALALRSNGTVVAWGANYSGETNVPAGVSNLVAIAAGGDASLALRNDGTLLTWGGTTNVPQGLDNVIGIAAGSSHYLALLGDGTVTAWGANHDHQSEVPPGLSNAVAIATDGSHNLVVRSDGTVVAWGNDGDTLLNVPAGLSNVVAVAASGAHDIALCSDGSVVEWGAGLTGWMLPPAGLRHVVAISAHSYHDLALADVVPFRIMSAPLNQSGYSGNPGLFRVAAVGTAPLVYQWRWNGTNLPGATNAFLLLPEVQPPQAGTYSVLVTDAWGNSGTAQANLSVLQGPPRIVGDPVSRVAVPGQTVSFEVKVRGSRPFSYQWRYEGSELTGATNGVLVLAAANPNQAGRYSVVVSNQFGVTISSNAVLEFTPVATWGGQDQMPFGLNLTGTIAIAAGGGHNLALRANGTVVGWGSDYSGEATVPAGLSNVVAIAAGGSHSLALRSDGTVAAWGYNSDGQANVPPDRGEALAIAAGAYHSVALRSDRTVVAWGDNDSGQTNVPPGLSNVIAIAARSDHTVALRSDGTVVVWGYHYYGELTPPPGLSDVIAIASGQRHVLALRSDGNVVAWGDNYYGQATVPPGLSNVVAIAAGENHSLVLQRDGTIVGWGDNLHGQLTVPVGLSNVVAIVGGWDYSLALSRSGPPEVLAPSLSQTVASGVTVALRAAAVGALPLRYQWRREGVDLLGATNAVLVLAAVQTNQSGLYSLSVTDGLGRSTTVQGTLTVLHLPPQIATGPISLEAYQGQPVSFTVSVTGSRPLSYQWRFEGAPLLGATKAVLALSGWTPAQAGRYSVLVGNTFGSVLSSEAALSVNPVVAWGHGEHGQLAVPAGLSNVVAVAAGSDQNLALQSDGKVVAWGHYWDSTRREYVRADVPTNLGNVVAVAAGSRHHVALRSDGTVVAWGLNDSHQLDLPPGLANVVALGAGGDHSLALRKDGTVEEWGSRSLVPPWLSNVVAIAAGNSHSLALRNDGTVVAWGDGFDDATSVPSWLDNVVSIAAGWGHSLALRSDGTVVAWGYDYSGQATVPTWLTRVIAIAAGGHHNLAMRSEPSIAGWGSDEYHQLTVPVGLNTVLAIAAGSSHSLAIAGVVPWRVLEAPQDQTANSGHPVLLRTRAIGAAPLRYQWGWNGANLAGATNSFLLLPAVQTNQAGIYEVTIRDGLSRTTNVQASLNVRQQPPQILVEPTNIAAFPGQSISFVVAAAGSGPLFYQWQLNGVDVPGATGRILALAGWTPAQAGRYAVTVSNSFGSITSVPALLTVNRVVRLGGDSYDLSAAQEDLDHAVAVAGGASFGLGLRDDGTVMAWGYSFYGVTMVPEGLSNVVALTTGPNHALALLGAGTIVAWGSDLQGQSTVPAGLSNVIAIASGESHSLALRRDGTVVAWGDNSYGQATPPPSLTDIVAVAAAGAVSLALRGDGTVVAWGAGFYGETNVPVGLSNVVAIATSGDRSLALRSDGTVVGWGHHATVPDGITNAVAVAAGRWILLGDGTVVGAGGPAPSGLNSVVAITDGLALAGAVPLRIISAPSAQVIESGHSIVLRVSAIGKVPLRYQWRRNGFDLPGATNAFLLLTAVQTNHSGTYAVGIRDGLGHAANAQATLAVRELPPQITAEPGHRAAFPGQRVTFEVIARGSKPLFYQWRFEGADLPGATNSTLSLEGWTPSQAGRYSVALSNAFGTRVSSEAVLEASRVVAWGQNAFGQTTIPTGLGAVATVVAGANHNLALRTDGTLAAWGYNHYGQAMVPAGLNQVVAIAAGANHSLALTGNGTIVVWGDNASGQCTIPADLSNVVAIAAGGDHSLALLVDGTVRAWGRDYYDMIRLSGSGVPATLRDVAAITSGKNFSVALRGDGTLVMWGRPALEGTGVPSGLNEVVFIAAGAEHSLAVRSDGTVAAWGNYYYSQNRVPVTLNNVVAVADGAYHSLALRQDGTVVAWGDTDIQSESRMYGLTDLPAGLSNVTVITAGHKHSVALVSDGSPALSVQPVGRTVVEGDTAFLHARAVGAPPMRFQWHLDGTNIPGATNATLALPNTRFASAGYYSVVASNAHGAVTSRVAVLQVLAPPSIAPLAAQMVVPTATNLTLYATATGTPPLVYQWRKNGVNITGATDATLAITNVQVADGGSYSVVVANFLGAVSSAPLWLVVEVTSQAPGENDFANRRSLTGANGFASGTNLFATREPGEPWHAGQAGSNSVWYSWTAPASGIATFRTVGSTFDTLLGIYTGPDLTDLTAVASDEDSGGFFTSEARFNVVANTEYQIAIDGLAGNQGHFLLNWALEETAAKLPEITGHPGSATVAEGGSYTFCVAASGTDLSYQWSFLGQAIVGATGACYAVASVQAEQVGSYRVRVSGGMETAESRPATLEIGPVTGIQSQDKPENLLPGPGAAGGGLAKGTAQAVTSSGGLTTIPVTMGTVDSQVMNNTGDTTQERESTSCGVIGGSSRWLSLKPATSGTLVLDTTRSTIDTVLAVYRAAPDYSDPFTFWATLVPVACDDNSAPDGVRSVVRMAAEAGTNYMVAVDGVSATNGIIRLNWALGRVPAVTSLPMGPLTVRQGQDVTWSVTVTNNPRPRPTYQWQRNLVDLSGATNATLTLSNVQVSDNGEYWVAVSNAIGVARAYVASLTIEPASTVLVSSDFVFDLEGWRLSGEGSILSFQPHDGNPGGHLWVSGSSGNRWFYWVAPGKFVGDQGAAYNGWLRFDLKQPVVSLPLGTQPDVVLQGGGLTLVLVLSWAGATNWTQFLVSLNEGQGWRKGTVGGPAPTKTEMQTVLRSLSAVHIRGEVGFGGEGGGLDTVSLEAAVPVVLQVGRVSETAIVLTWPVWERDYVLETCSDLGATWTPVGTVPVVLNGLKQVPVTITNGSAFFRLSKPGP